MEKPTLKEMWDALGQIGWTEEYGELELTVNHTLTEPTCPTAIIGTENRAGPAWRADRETVDDAIYFATLAAYMTIVSRKPKPMTFPAPDIDEDERVTKYLAAIDARSAA